MRTQYLTQGNADPAEAYCAIFHAQPLREKTGERLYKARNLCHYLEDGNIEFWDGLTSKQNDAC